MSAVAIKITPLARLTKGIVKKVYPISPSAMPRNCAVTRPETEPRERLLADTLSYSDDRARENPPLSPRKRKSDKPSP
jgi:hypothetical protein